MNPARKGQHVPSEATRTVTSVVSLDEKTMVDPNSLEVVAPFKDVFPINPAVRDAIEWSMKEDGYDEGFPIIVWLERKCVLDGHTRLDVAKSLGLQVPVVYKNFTEEDDALEYAINCQKNRRNLTDADIWRYVKALDQRKPPGGEAHERGNQYKSGSASRDALPPKPNRTAAKTAEIIGTNTTKVERVRLLMDRAPEEVKNRLEGNGPPITINRAYQLTKQEEDKKRQEKPTKPEQLRNLFDFSRKQDEKPAPPAPEPADPGGFASAVLGDGADDDIKLYWHLRPLIQQIEKACEDLLGKRSTAWMTPYHARVQMLIGTPDPLAWVKCTKCRGEKIRDGQGTCSRCMGHGYHLPRQER